MKEPATSIEQIASQPVIKECALESSQVLKSLSTEVLNVSVNVKSIILK